MGNWLIDESKFDEVQLKVLESNNNVVVQGCAGSGKTLLAVHRASRIQRKNQGSYLIVVYTKALRTFIKDGVNKLKIPDTNVLYEWQFHTAQPKTSPESMMSFSLADLHSRSADYLFIDEAQDFAAEDIDLFQKRAKKGICFFGDTAQQVYPNGKINYNKKVSSTNLQTVSIEQIVQQTGLATIKLEYNYRLPKNIARLAQTLLTDGSDIVSNCKNEDGNLPEVKFFADENEEIQWICQLIDQKGFKNVGILVSDNAQVFALYNYFQQIGKSDSIGAKYTQGSNNVDVLDFKRDINIMTYHSAKGLQFDTVFLPFCHVQESNFYRGAFYVALTRASINLIITYHQSLTGFISRQNVSLYKKI